MDSTISSVFTCVSCHVAFGEAGAQRSHYQSDWHRYNLKRKVAGMPPVSADDFAQRVQAQQQKNEAEQQSAHFSARCDSCGKSFSTENSYQNHLQSKKHREMAAASAASPAAAAAKKHPKSAHAAPVAPADIAVPPTEANAEKEERDKEENGGEMDDVDRKIAKGSHLTPEQCLFCTHASATFSENMEHMTKKHSFFVPDIEYVVDLEGLVAYLGEKLSIGNICLYCNERSKSFQSLEAVRKHMIDKGHCKLYYEEDADVELADFYDFRPSYPDYDPSKPDSLNQDDDDDDDDNTETAAAAAAPRIEENAYQLVLADGTRLGHRSMKLYYRQKFRPEEDRNSITIHRLMSQYKLLGWHNQPVEAQRDENRRIRSDQHRQLDLGVKANRFQPHFREQVMY